MTGKDLPSLSVVVPVFNEENNVVRTIRAVGEKIGARTKEYEIILVDDGSTDHTGERAKETLPDEPRLRIIHHPRNLGYGAALRSGFSAARYPLIFYTDGDLQFDLAEIDRLVALLDGADIVTAYRLNRQDPWYRKFNAAAYNFLIRGLFGVRIRDLDCAFKIYRRRIFDSFDIQASGIFVSAEILVQASRRGFVIRQVGVTHYPRTQGVAKGNKPAIVLTAFRELTRFCWRLWWFPPRRGGKGNPESP